MAFEFLTYDVADRVATITLNRPDRMNALNIPMIDEIIAAFDESDADDEVKAVVVTGAGKAFCAGADLESGSGGGNPFKEARKESHRDSGGRMTLRIWGSRKPVIGAINGASVGLGTTMQLPMDIRVASDRAKFGFVFPARGITPDGASTWFLPRLVGISKAMEWISTARVFGADEALAGGLIRSVHPGEELLEVAYGLAAEIADNTSAMAVSLARKMLWQGLGLGHPMQSHIIESRALGWIGQTDEPKEGVTAFMEKRPAKFPLRVSQDLPDFYPWWDEPEFTPLP